MTSDEIDKFFKTKYDFLDKFIQNADAMSNTLGLPRIEKAVMILHGNVLRNIKDLYFMHEITMKAIYDIRSELVDLHRQAGSTEGTATQLKERFNATLGSLENRLKEINERDAEEQKKLGDVSFYG